MSEIIKWSFCKSNCSASLTDHDCSRNQDSSFPALLHEHTDAAMQAVSFAAARR